MSKVMLSAREPAAGRHPLPPDFFIRQGLNPLKQQHTPYQMLNFQAPPVVQPTVQPIVQQDPEKTRLQEENRELRAKLAAALAEVEKLKEQVKRLAAAPKVLVDNATTVKPQAAATQVYTGLPQGNLAVQRAVTPVQSLRATQAPGLAVLQNVKPSVQNAPVVIEQPRVIETHQGGATIRQPVVQPIVHSVAQPLTKPISQPVVSPVVQTFTQPGLLQRATAGIQIGGTNQIVNGTTRVIPPQIEIPPLSSVGTQRISGDLGMYTSPQERGLESTEVRELQTSQVPLSSPDRKPTTPRGDAFRTPESKRSRSPPPASTTQQAKLKEANARIRYLADENDKLIGRLHKFKIVEEEMQKRELLFEKKVAAALQERLDAERLAQQSQEAAEALAAQVEHFKRMLQADDRSDAKIAEQPVIDGHPQHEDEVKPKKKKDKKTDKVVPQPDAIPEVSEDLLMSPAPAPKFAEPDEEEAPKKKKKKAKAEAEETPREEAPQPQESIPQTHAEVPEEEVQPKKTKKKKAKTDESEAPVETAPQEEPIAEEAGTVKKKKGTKKKKEE